MRKAPTKDTTSHAFGDGPYLEAKDNMFTNAFGVAPKNFLYEQAHISQSAQKYRG